MYSVKPSGDQPADELRHVNLALQGGGSHGAYTWGVLDRFLEEESLSIEGISGTSAGAINAVVMMDGYIKGGRSAAKKALADFWLRMSELSNPLPTMMYENLYNGWNLDTSPFYIYFDMMTRVFSPYQMNMFNINPLKDLLIKNIDFEAVRRSEKLKLFVTATSVTTGQARVFANDEMSIDTIMASCCLPSMYQAVQIDDDFYWDGGYSGNPSIWPLTDNCASPDTIIVEINPVVRRDIPKQGNDIINRMNEISFNASLIAELRSIALVNKLIEDNHLKNPKYRPINIHLIEAAQEMLELNASSKLNTNWEFLTYLHGLGRASAEKWLSENLAKLGESPCVVAHKALLRHA